MFHEKWVDRCGGTGLLCIVVLRYCSINGRSIPDFCSAEVEQCVFYDSIFPVQLYHSSYIPLWHLVTIAYAYLNEQCCTVSSCIVIGSLRALQYKSIRRFTAFSLSDILFLSNNLAKK